MSNGYSCDSNKSITLQLIRTESDFTDGLYLFNPLYTHQIVDQSERIFGYKWVKVGISMTAAKLTTLLEIEYGPTMDSQNARPDDVESLLSKYLKGGYLTDRDKFLDELRKEKGERPPGDLVYSSLVEMNGTPTEIEIFHCSRSEPRASEWMANMQILSPLLIETAVPINFDTDPRWNLFSLYERQGDSSPEYFHIGFATVYNFYFHPHSVRPRISQFMILPPFQRRGLAPHLLQGIYVYYRNVTTPISDIVVEESSVEFQKIRDLVDCREATHLPCLNSGNFSLKSMNQFLREVKDRLKLSRNQSFRVFEILLWKERREMDSNQRELCEMAIKRRILWNLMADHRSKKEFLADLKEKGLVTTMKEHLKFESYEMVKDLFEHLVDDYNHVIIRLNSL